MRTLHVLVSNTDIALDEIEYSQEVGAFVRPKEIVGYAAASAPCVDCVFNVKVGRTKLCTPGVAPYKCIASCRQDRRSVIFVRCTAEEIAEYFAREARESAREVSALLIF
jgi:hypothetical protein